MARRCVALVALAVVCLARPVLAQDMLDLHSCVIEKTSPADIADWPLTEAITRVAMDPRGGVSLTFVPTLPERWKFFTDGGNGENFQFTVWPVVYIGGQCHTAGIVQMWQGRSMTDGSLPPILTGYRNWWNDGHAPPLFGGMTAYIPAAGDAIGFFVTAGNARLTTWVSSVRERSNVVVVHLPAGDAGAWGFAGEAPQPVPTPQPAPVPTPQPPPVYVPPQPVPSTVQGIEGVLIAKLDSLTQKVDALTAIETEQSRADGDAHKSINQNITDGRAENKSALAPLGAVLEFVSKYIAPALGTFIACHSTGKC